MITERTRRSKSRQVKKSLQDALYVASAVHNEMYDETTGFSGAEAVASEIVVNGINQALSHLAWYEAWAREQAAPPADDE